MPSITIAPNSVDKARVEEVLARALPDLEVTKLGVTLAVAESKWAGALISISKKKIVVNGGIPSMKSMMLALLILVVGLVVIPAIIYGTKVMPRQKAIAERVTEVLQREFGTSG